ncbi:MAG: nickel pincer cofactor biosynthesis protein LarC [Nitrospinae bacterium]|nr:nickel pincer cofactor biosynthesis protein LarC [Nitrospinota bacterium]
MKIAYLDAFSGISGDMVVGALIDLGVPLAYLKRELKKIDVHGYRLTAEPVKRSGIAATQFGVHITKKQKSRDYAVIRRLIETSKLDAAVKETALLIFKNIAVAEAKVHNQSIEKVHFHEVGAVDSIVDIVAVALGFHRLGITRFACSPIPTGGGMVDTMHGMMPVPAPATILLLKGIPLTPDATPMELTTPTGAAIAAALAENFGPMPAMKPLAVGYGAGTKIRQDRVPNLFRIVLGEPAGRGKRLMVLETNIDDATPESLGYATLKILGAGALDVWVASVTMKKGRQAFVLSVLCDPLKAADLRNLMLEETPTLGVRQYEVERFELERKVIKVKTKFGEVRIKEALTPGGQRRLKPEYDDCKALAEKAGKPFDAVYRAALGAALK